MSIVTKIETIVNDLGYPFIYGSTEQIDYLVDSATLPCIYLYRLTNGTAINNAGVERDSVNILLFFVTQTSFEETDYNNETYIEQMRELSLEFLFELQKSSLLISGTVATQRVYEAMGRWLTGVALQFTVTDTEGVVDCFPSLPIN